MSTQRLLPLAALLALALAPITDVVGQEGKDGASRAPAERAGAEAEKSAKAEKGLEGVTAFRAGRIVRVEGDALQGGVLLVKDGAIHDILTADQPVPGGLEVEDLGDGATVLPLFVNPLSRIHTLGSSIHGSRGSMLSERGREQDRQAVKSSDAVNPKHKIYRELERAGFGALGLNAANGDLISGRAVVVSPTKTTEKKELVLVEDAYLSMSYTPARTWKAAADRSFGKALAAIKKRRDFEKARAEAKKKAAEDAKKGAGAKNDAKNDATKDGEKPAEGAKAAEEKPPPPPGPLEEVLLGGRTAVVRVTSRAALDHFLRITGELSEPFRFIVVLPSVNASYVERLAAEGERIRGVILEARISRLRDRSTYFSSARLFHGAGIPLALLPLRDDLEGHRDLLFHLGELVKTGLPEAAAFRAITLAPATMIGAEERLGSLEKGKDASFVVFDEDPLSGLATPARVYRRGELVHDRSKLDETEDDEDESDELALVVETGPYDDEEIELDFADPDDRDAVAAGERSDAPAKAAASEDAKKDESKTKEAPEEPVHAIVGGTVLPVSGPPIHRGVVLFRKGKILAVGSEVKIPEGAVIHSAHDGFVTPGLVAIEASVGGARASRGNFADELDPYHRDFVFVLSAGITTMRVVNTYFGGFFRSSPSPGGGPTAIIKATAGDLDDMLVREPASTSLSLRRSMLSSRQFVESFQKAKDYLEQLETARREKKKAPKMPRGISSYVDALKKTGPTIVEAGDVDVIRALLDVRERFDFNLVVGGADSGWKLARRLTALDVPVILRARGADFNFNIDEPLFGDDRMIPIRLPAAWAAGGTRVVLRPYRLGVSLDGLAGRDLTALAFEAAFAVRGGLEQATALRSITLEPARVLHVDDRVGSLEEGKDADIVIWSGHPLHYRSLVEQAWINGKVRYDRVEDSPFRAIRVGG